ncbi:Histidine ammonia-lyase [uncultured Pleomorphomonas sp.]|uniref:Histidine ammonia-lyase n=1 Tax=uncultured Pleomorphomonas sp. TaxID=442121 RepID=A0A212L9Y4_9HYPH|nr:histidine ammonia-lyase [uncultured Pleomorphomonas sp.]SCM74394.1 Histidine ammonia-lyase [uncultured Pleomorphomonas sp.]
MTDIVVDTHLGWRDVAAVAEGARLRLSEAAKQRINNARAVVEAIVDRGMRAYGVNTGVGALCDVVVDRPLQRQLSHNILMSHATGIGAPLGSVETRAIMATAIGNYALGHSGVRLEVVEALAGLLNADVTPLVPAKGSVGYLSHMAHIALVLIGAGRARVGEKLVAGAEALAAAGLVPLELGAKEGLSLVNGTPCATGLASLALKRAERALDWADAIAALTIEALMGNPAAFDAAALSLRASPSLQAVGAGLRDRLAGSGIIAAGAGRKTQDALSLRAVPHVHGAARDAFAAADDVVSRELSSVSDNPAIVGTPEAPGVHSEAHAVGAAMGLALDQLAVAVAEVAAMAERRLDRLVNPLVSGLPAFLAADSGVNSGFMIAQYAAVSLVNENRRLSLPASLDGGITSALQEDHLSHATPASLKALTVIENAEAVLGIELLAAAQAHEFRREGRAAGTDRLYRQLRTVVPSYADDRPLADDMALAADLIRAAAPA